MLVDLDVEWSGRRLEQAAGVLNYDDGMEMEVLLGWEKGDAKTHIFYKEPPCYSNIK